MQRKCRCNGSRGTDCDFCGGSGIMEVKIQDPVIPGGKPAFIPIKKKPEIQSSKQQKTIQSQKNMPIQIAVAKRVRDKIQEYYQRPNDAYRHAAILVRNRLSAMTAEGGTQDVVYGNIGGFGATNHGETRIENCQKYHLGYQDNNVRGNTSFRLVTIELKVSNLIVVVFFGDHDETESWINSNRGYKLIYKEINNTIFLEEVLMSGTQPLILDKGLINGKLYKYIEKQWIANIKPRLTQSEIEHFENFDANSDNNLIKLLADFVKDEDLEFKKMLYDTFIIIRSGEVKMAISRIKLYFDSSINEPIAAHSQKTIRRNDAFVNLRTLTPIEVEQFMSLGYDDVIVYLHPDQEIFAKKNYQGTVRISGVSGSGKTSILTNRAVTLAARSIPVKDSKPILVLSLNTALTELLERGIKRIIESKFSSNPDLARKLESKIQVKSLWQLFYELICERIGHLKPYDQNIIRKSLQEHAHKSEQTIEEIWEIFYKHPLIPFDYPPEHFPHNENLIGIHKYILDKNLDPCLYIKDEFDYIRSYLNKSNYTEYLSTDRKNRLFPILSGDGKNLDGANRHAILDGLQNWEKFMDFNGTADYAHVTIRLHQLIADLPKNNKIKPKYSSILVDESQDLGTNEMKIIRDLVESGNNDLFLVGDFAQKIHVKRLNFNHAGLNVIHHFKLYQNYRNSMEILSAADKVLMHNWQSNSDNTGNAEHDQELIQNPEYSNLHSGNINIIQSANLEEEILNSTNFIHDDSKIAPNRKYCVVICGYSKFEIAQLKSKNKLFDKYIMLNTIIDHHARGVNNTNFNEEKYFISDLEHCKGFEFDTVIIVNANKSAIPKINNTDSSTDIESSSNNEISKFYVAMTRAKTNLIISYSNILTPFLDIPNREEEFNCNASWGVSLGEGKSELNIDLEKRFSTSSWKQMTGKELLFTEYAIGLSKETQEKLLKTVTGKSVDTKTGGKTVKEEFTNIKALLDYIKNPFNTISVNRLFGNDLAEIKFFLSKIE
jgi:superfamily I DNA/RNA helicase